MQVTNLPVPMIELAAWAKERPHLELLVLHGSRARGEAAVDADWDFAFLASPGFDLFGALSELSELLRTDRVDLADLSLASGLLRYRAARDGVLAYERAPGAFDAFRIEAATFWCEAGPLIRRGYEEVLARLGP